MISSQDVPPRSVAYIRLARSQASPSTSRKPPAYTTVPPGLPGAGLPSGVSRRIFPARLLGSAASFGSPASPVPTYRYPSGPKASRPPSPVAPYGIPVRIGCGVPPRVSLATRLSCAVE